MSFSRKFQDRLDILSLSLINFKRQKPSKANYITKIRTLRHEKRVPKCQNLLMIKTLIDIMIKTVKRIELKYIKGTSHLIAFEFSFLHVRSRSWITFVNI